MYPQPPQDQQGQPQGEQPTTATSSTPVLGPQQLSGIEPLKVPTSGGTKVSNNRIRNLFMGIAAAAILIAGGAAAYALFVNGNKPAAPASTTNTRRSSTPASTPTATSTNPTAGWVKFDDVAAGLSFKHPAGWVVKYCTGSILLIGASQQTLGSCTGASPGQMFLGYADGDMRSQFALQKNAYSNIATSSVTVSGVAGDKESGTVTNAQSEGMPVGTNVVDYNFYTNGKTYGFGYAQLPGLPDVLSKYELMVTQTLKFGV